MPFLPNPVSESVSTLNYSERWLRDGLSVIEPAGGICTLDIDMSRCAACLAD